MLVGKWSGDMWTVTTGAEIGAGVATRWILVNILFLVENVVQDMLTRRRLSTGLCLDDAKGLSRVDG